MLAKAVSVAISRSGDSLTPAERRIASEIVEDPALLTFGSVSDLAERAETSRATIVRFANKLGFDGYTSLQDIARQGVTEQLTRPTDRVRNSNETLDDNLDRMKSGLQQLRSLISSGQIKRLAPPIAAAESVWIVAGETSQASGHALHSGLSILRPGVHLLDERTLGHDLANASPQDLAIISDFARYRKSSITAARALMANDVPIVAITDGPLSPLSAQAIEVIELKIDATGPFDSSIATVGLAELLVAEVAKLNRTTVQKRIDRTEQLWRTTETFLDSATTPTL